jgi:hypothetical protein
MGRPKPSDAVREFSATFARIVTISSQNRYDWVARIGKYSIYSLLSFVVPKVLGYCERDFKILLYKFPLINDRLAA